MTQRLLRTLATVALIASLLPMAAAAVPADTTDGFDGVEKATLLRLLNADSAEKQARAARLIGTYAHNARHDADYFRVLVTPLHGLVAQGKTEAVRIMAVAALSAIGTEAAMQGLKAQVDRLESERVQKFTRHALVRYATDEPTMTVTRRDP